MTNLQVAELLALRSEEADGQRQRAYRRAARSAMYWPDEVADLVTRGVELTDLNGIGPKISGLIKSWLEEPPEIPEPPPARRGFMTFAEARATVAAHPEWPQLRGDLQMHTRYSDGKVSVAEMAEAGKALGYEYISITDHSVGLKIAGGMREEELDAELREIDALNEGFDDFRIFRSLEMNISPEGRGDMEEVTGRLDLVVGSFHSKLRGTEDQTERYVRALSNPSFQIMGHPRCRMFNSRLGLKADWEVVVAAAAKFGKALEINSHPNRQDLNVEILEIARDSDVHLSIGTDAHATSEMDFAPLALAAAIKAGLTPDRIVNFMPADELLAWAAR